MSSAQIREAIEKTSKRISEEPAKARTKNPAATAAIEGTLRCRITGPGGETLNTDMPPGMGGSATAPTPGWLMRAALASCSATCIAMQAAQRGISLTRLDVTVSSETDNRGLLGLDDAAPVGMQSLHVQVRISAPGTPAQELNDLVRWANSHSPVGCTDPSTARLDIQIEEA